MLIFEGLGKIFEIVICFLRGFVNIKITSSLLFVSSQADPRKRGLFWLIIIK